MKKIDALLLVSLPFVSYAELSDKIPSISNMWLLSIALGMFALIASLRFNLPLLFAVFTSVFLAYGVYNMYADPTFRKVVYSDQGVLYFYHGYASAFVVFTLALFGAVFKKVKVIEY